MAGKTLSLILFTTQWNGSCQIVEMIFEELEKVYGTQIDFNLVSLEKDAALGKKYGISEAPAILFFKDGKVIDYSVGLISKSTLISKIGSALSAPL